MRVRVGLFCLALSLCGGAASADIAADCSQGMNDELRIAACTEVIQRRNQPPDGLARAYRSCGTAFLEIGSQDQDIADFTEALSREITRSPLPAAPKPSSPRAISMGPLPIIAGQLPTLARPCGSSPATSSPSIIAVLRTGRRRTRRGH